MESLRIALETVLPLFLLLAIGYVVKLSGMMNETSVRQMNKVIFQIFLPLLVFTNIYNTELAESFRSDLLLYAVAGVLIQFLLSLCIVLLGVKDNAKRGVMLQGMFRSNFVLFGIPISTTLYGDTAAGLASILIAVIIPLYNALAVVALEMFNGKKPSFFKGLKKEFKKIVFPDRHTVTKQTIAVVLASIFLGALIAILDLVIKFGLGFIL